MNEALDFRHSNASGISPLTLEDLKKAVSKIVVGSTGTGKNKNWFERLMNKFGWFRSSEWYLLRTDQFNQWPFLAKDFKYLNSDLETKKQ